jgi:glycerol-3-phosphate dehydrogenase subunit C
MHYDPNAPSFWEPAALAAELERVATVCHGCRLCFNLCPSFPNLFERVDAHDGDVPKLGPTDYASVVDDCYGCKLCYVKCPYTPPHELRIDFPALMLRERAVRAKREGIPFRERLLSRVDRAGKANRFAAPLVNASLRLAPVRWLMEKVVGIHRKARLPKFRFRTFASWAKGLRKPAAAEGPSTGLGAGAPAVAVFPTCFVNYNEPSIGKALVAVLEHNGASVSCPATLCCGMPFLDAGDVDGARSQAKRSLPALAEAARQGRPVLVPQPTCAYMLKYEWPSLVPGEDAAAVSKAVEDPSAWLLSLKARGGMKTDFVPGKVEGAVGYHFACHLQALGTGPKSRDLLASIPGVRVTVSEKCSGHDGTYAYKVESKEQSVKQGQKLFRALSEPGLRHLVSDCPLAARQIEEGVPNGPKPLHPMVLLARAYGLPEGHP